MQQYRHHSIRLPDFDYTQPAWYFVTLVCEQRINRFGVISSRKMAENPIGRMVRQEWQKISQRFFNVELDEFIVMPNHMHGIIIIKGSDELISISLSSREGFGRPVPGSIPTIIRSFKGAVTLRARSMLGDPEAKIWQRNYFEHVIRDVKGLEAARLYIRENPTSWELDQENGDRSNF
jgi:REP element-mobilizing transposase RayT